MALLGHSVIGSVEDPIRRENSVAASFESFDHFLQDTALVPDGQALHVFESEVSGLQLEYQTDEMMHKRIAGIVEDTLSDQGKTLAWSAAEHDGDVPVAYAGYATDVNPSDIVYTATDRFTVGEVELMRCAMDWVDLNCGCDVEPGGLETETQPPSPCKQVNSDRSHCALHLHLRASKLEILYHLT